MAAVSKSTVIGEGAMGSGSKGGDVLECVPLDWGAWFYAGLGVSKTQYIYKLSCLNAFLFKI